MNGAESLIEALGQGGVDVCFANPGTSEMHLVAALDRSQGIRCVLVLFEGIATGAADGYARMTGKPAVTLLHLGPGLGNALANIHNAGKAVIPMVNVVGDHATYHRKYDAPLTSDVEAIAAPISRWVKSCADAGSLGRDMQEAIAASRSKNGQIATLIVPADCAWNEVQQPTDAPPMVPTKDDVPDRAVKAASRMLSEGNNAALFVGGAALVEPGLSIAARIAAHTGARLLSPTGNARTRRGAGSPVVSRLPYPVDGALAMTKDLESVVLCGADAPVAFFAYPGKPSEILPEGCRTCDLANPSGDVLGALRALEAELGAEGASIARYERSEEPPATGEVTAKALGQSIAAMLPQDAIVVDEAITSGFALLPPLLCAAPHDHLQLTGGAIGDGLPLALGAAIAAPERKTICLQADGSGMYTPQALWSMVREDANVLIVILANRAYETLRGELTNVGAGDPGPNARAMIDLVDPEINWVSLANSLGMSATRCEDMSEFNAAFETHSLSQGPHLIEAVLR